MSNAKMSFDTTHTAEVSGTGQLTASDVRTFLSEVPDFATLKLQGESYSHYPGEPYGSSTPWKITATWKDAPK